MMRLCPAHTDDSDIAPTRLRVAQGSAAAAEKREAADDMEQQENTVVQQ